MTAKLYHVVGAGLAGLSAAVTLAAAGHKVALYEAAAHAGGRCRSYFDRELGCRIDNGNHMMMAANVAALAYLTETGALETLAGAEQPCFPFVDVITRRRWAIRPNRGRLPWWVLVPGRRAPHTRIRDYIRARALLSCSGDDTVSRVLEGHGPIYRALWEPLAVSALNTRCSEASAQLLGVLLRRLFGEGGDACRPMLPKVGLSETLVDPALAYLEARGTVLHTGQRLRHIQFDEGGARVKALAFAGEIVDLGPDDGVILAVPAPVAAEVVPGLIAPTEFRAIINAHFRCDVPALKGGFIGVVGGLAEWIFTKPGVVSVTISAADHLLERTADELAEAIWADVVEALDLGPRDVPPFRIVKEKRATLAATPEQLRLRPVATTAWVNLALAGDWTETGLPSTIEGAIQSGNTAAKTFMAGRLVMA